MINNSMKWLKYYRQFLFSKKCIVFHQYDFEDLQFIEEDSSGIYFSHFSDEDVNALSIAIEKMEFPAEFDLNETFERLKRGYKFYLAKSDNRIIGYVWVTIDNYLIPYCNAAITLGKTHCYTINGYVNNKYRGIGLFNRLKAYAFQDLKKNGYKKAIGSYFSWNKASEKMNQKFGSKIIGKIEYGYIGGLNYYSVSKELEFLNIEFKEATLSFWKRLISRVF